MTEDIAYSVKTLIQKLKFPQDGQVEQEEEEEEEEWEEEEAEEEAEDENVKGGEEAGDWEWEYYETEGGEDASKEPVEEEEGNVTKKILLAEIHQALLSQFSLLAKFFIPRCSIKL